MIPAFTMLERWDFLPPACPIFVPVLKDRKTGAGLPARAAFYCIRLISSSLQAVSGGGVHLLPRLAATTSNTRAGRVSLGIVAHRQTRLTCKIARTGARDGSRLSNSAARRREQGRTLHRTHFNRKGRTSPSVQRVGQQ
jgi:hypothetical protein